MNINSSAHGSWSTRAARLLIAVCAVACGGSSAAETFTFSGAAEAERREAEAQAQAVRQMISAPCQGKVKNQRTLLLIAERTQDQWNTQQERYGPHFQVLEARLRALGLKTYTQEQIRGQIAQAELDAYFNNDPDAALAASKRLGANYVLRGNISTLSGVNPVVGVNEVAVNLDITLSDASGKLLSEARAHSESYAGTDTLGMALTLVREQADQLVAQLYGNYCRSVGIHDPNSD